MQRVPLVRDNTDGIGASLLERCYGGFSCELGSARSGLQCVQTHLAKTVQMVCTSFVPPEVERSAFHLAVYDVHDNVPWAFFKDMSEKFGYVLDDCQSEPCRDRSGKFLQYWRNACLDSGYMMCEMTSKNHVLSATLGSTCEWTRILRSDVAMECHGGGTRTRSCGVASCWRTYAWVRVGL